MSRFDPETAWLLHHTINTRKVTNMVYALVMIISIASAGTFKPPLVVQGFLSPTACNVAANAVISQLKVSNPGASEQHVCVSNFTAP